jgi:hypothetical protein
MWKNRKKRPNENLKLFFVGLVCLMVLSHGFLPGQDTAVQNRELGLSKRLAMAGKVWGFLKYFHPRVATRAIDWDQVLIDRLPDFKGAVDVVSFNQELDNLIIQAGDAGEGAGNSDSFIHPDPELFRWIAQDPILSGTVRTKLRGLLQNYVPAPNFYAGYGRAGQVSPQNEKYIGLNYNPPEGDRILALFRYWNIINYFFPYRDLIDENWDVVLEDLIPTFLNAGNALELAWAMAEMAARTDDTHCNLSSIYYFINQGFYFAPAEVIYTEGKTVVSRVWEATWPPERLKVGDVILECRGQNIDTFRASMLKYAHGSNDAARQRFINQCVTRHTEITLPFKIERDGQIMDIAIRGVTRDYITGQKEKERFARKKWDIMEGNIGYVNLGVLYQPDIDRVMPRLLNTRAIVFDVRNYPNNPHRLLLNYLNPEPKMFCTFKVPLQNVPGAFLWEDSYEIGGHNPDYYRGKVILLVNEKTQSHAEFVCMALQTAPDVTVIGSRTAGADGNVARVPLPGAATLTFSGIGIYYPNGDLAQQVGITPDIYIRPTVQGIRQGQDEVLKRALEFIETTE